MHFIDTHERKNVCPHSDLFSNVQYIEKVFSTSQKNFSLCELTFYGLDRRDIERFLWPFDKVPIIRPVLIQGVS